MPYLPIEFDGRKQCAHAASLLGVSPGDLSWGLQELWEHAWRANFVDHRPAPDVVSELVLLGCLGVAGANPRAAEVLTAFGFLESVPNLTVAPPVSGYRIRGAAKWLFGLEGKRRGGQKSKGNLIPGGPKSAEGAPASNVQVAGECRDLSREGAETPAETQPSALGLWTVDTASRSKSLDSVGEVGALRDALDAAWTQMRGGRYFWTRDDEDTIRALAGQPEAEIVRRFRNGLSTDFPKCLGVRSLHPNKHWNAYANAAGPVRDVRKGTVRAEDSKYDDEPEGLREGI